MKKEGSKGVKMLDPEKQKRFEYEVKLDSIFREAWEGKDVFCPYCGKKLIKYGARLYCPNSVSNSGCKFDYTVN